ncbi:hypothetical protein ABMA27_006982 [Loxostege sticticalis]|uniref:Uncharacterized protein n=1 Tax=Loxostege sticticalis TaxID=481309 RepID=A0ABR3IL85_LOXSC
MTKLALAVALMIFAVVQGYPQTEAEISDAASKGDWDLVHKLIQQRFETQRNLWEPNVASGSVRSLKPQAGGHVYGEASYSFKTESIVGDKKTENKGGHKIINNDGVVKEYDFEPKL